MIQVTKENGVWTFYGLSTDDKDDAKNSSYASSFRPLLFKEIDTSKKYYYDSESGEWREWGGGA